MNGVKSVNVAYSILDKCWDKIKKTLLTRASRVWSLFFYYIIITEHVTGKK